jgi:hypothetical protein
MRNRVMAARSPAACPAWDAGGIHSPQRDEATGRSGSACTVEDDGSELNQSANRNTKQSSSVLNPAPLIMAIRRSQIFQERSSTTGFVYSVLGIFELWHIVCWYIIQFRPRKLLRRHARRDDALPQAATPAVPCTRPGPASPGPGAFLHRLPCLPRRACLRFFLPWSASSNRVHPTKGTRGRP